MATPNPPIPGHHLLHEGQTYHRWDGRTGEHIWVGGCFCGARPPEFPDISKRAMQRWHREHKAKLRQAFGFPGVPTEVEVLKKLVEEWVHWAEHPSTCGIEQYGPRCDCGLDLLRERSRAVLS